MFIKNNRRFNLDAFIGSVWVDDQGAQHQGILLQDPVFRAAHGIEEIPDPVRGNDETEYTQEIDVAPYVIITPKSPEQIEAALKAKLTNWIQQFMDSEAVKAGYDNLISACSYAAVANTYQAEGIAFLEWRSACWDAAYALLADIKANGTPIPDRDTLLVSLPVRVGGTAYVPEPPAV